MEEKKRFSTSLVWYHRSAEMPTENQKIVAYSPKYLDADPDKIRIMNSQFYKFSIDAEWWAYVNIPKI